jgi:6-pyruvoyltetrahydropterin/6-carboxytetrahydropterin synthase
MAVAYLTRVVAFSALHRYFRPDWSKERNAATFGETVREHGHDYRCEVTVMGTPAPETGMVIDLGALDRLLSEEVAERFGNRRIHADIPEFADGKLIPTGEMICIDIWRRLSVRLPDGCGLHSVKVAEDETLWSEYRGEA